MRVHRAGGRLRPKMDRTAVRAVDPRNRLVAAEMERVLILQTLREKNYNRTETARALGISRRALIYKLRRLAEKGYAINPE
jgi:DNA-binding NtrC family response regulator